MHDRKLMLFSVKIYAENSSTCYCTISRTKTVHAHAWLRDRKKAAGRLIELGVAPPIEPRPTTAIAYTRTPWGKAATCNQFAKELMSMYVSTSVLLATALALTLTLVGGIQTQSSRSISKFS